MADQEPIVDGAAAPGMSNTSKLAVGGIAVAALVGAAAVGAIVVGAGGHKIYQSHQGSTQDKSTNKLYLDILSGHNLQAADHGGKDLVPSLTERI